MNTKKKNNYEEGRKDGYEEGRKDGYEEGFAECQRLSYQNNIGRLSHRMLISPARNSNNSKNRSTNNTKKTQILQQIINFNKKNLVSKNKNKNKTKAPPVSTGLNLGNILKAKFKLAHHSSRKASTTSRSSSGWSNNSSNNSSSNN